MRRRLRVRTTGLALGLFALASLAFLAWLVSRREAHLAIAIACLAAIVIDVVLAARAVAKAELDLRGPDEAAAGAPSTWTLQVRGWVRPITLTPRLTARQDAVLVPDGRVSELTWPALQRGTVPFAVVDLTSSGPLGLGRAGRRQQVVLPAPLHVTPAKVDVDVAWPKARAIGFGTVEGSTIGDDLVRSIRPYQHGDGRRRVHWKATAHHGQLMVRESDGLGVVLVRVIADLGFPGPGAELAAARTAAVAIAALDRGWNVELVTLDAADEVPRLASLGAPFGQPPTLVAPPLLPLPTISAPVRNAREVRRRLATAACGTPASTAGRGWRGLTCRVHRDGIEWT